jgi:hypothetical protein
VSVKARVVDDRRKAAGLPRRTIERGLAQTVLDIVNADGKSGRTMTERSFW